MEFNKVILSGHLGADAEIKETFATFSLAEGIKYTTKDGKVIEKTNWHNCITRAVKLAPYLKKGMRIGIEGKLDYTKKGEKLFTNILVHEVVFFEKKRPEQTAAPESVKSEPETDLPF